jgi:hypothetical protein
MSFTRRNLAPRRPVGEVIPHGVRVAILRVADGRGVSATGLWAELTRLHAWGTFSEVAEDIGERIGSLEAQRFEAAMTAHFEAKPEFSAFIVGHDEDAEPALLAVPAPFFLDIIEDWLIHSRYAHDRHEDVREINRLFETRGVWYRFDDEGRARWVGDEGTYEKTIRPALRVLSDPRLAACRSEFEAALGHLRSGTPKDDEDAIEEAGKAVESAMKVLLEA